jgi:putative endonuclease
MAKDQHIKDGAWAEQMAVTYLSQTDYQILERNWRYKRAEIDLVCSLNGKLVLVEVKYRKEDYFGEPEGAVADLKVQKMQEAAEGYMGLHPDFEEVLFDIISITGPKENAKLVHFKDAFFPDNLR